MRSFLVTIFVIVLGTCVHAQDPHFSQFFASPLTLNPASTGKFDGALRLAANYKNQWPSIPNAYRTYAASADFPVVRSEHGDVLGLGFSGLSDQSVNGALNYNYGSVSLAFHKSLDESGYNTLGVGFQGTYSTINIDQSKLTFEDQILNFTAVSQEQTSGAFSSGTSRNYFDMNAGILFSGSSDGDNNYYAGISMYHLNQPAIGFEDKKWKLKPRTTINAGGNLPLNDQYSLGGSFIYQVQSEASEFVIGGALCANVNNSIDNPTNVYVGSWYRLNDAVIPYVALEFSGLRIGFTYDVNVSSLKAGTKQQGGTELSLIYIKKSDGNNSIPCPKF